MRLLLDQIQEPFEWQESVPFEADSFETDDLRELGPVEVSGRLEPVHPGFHLRLRLVWNQTMECTRCLEPITGTTTIESHLLLMTDDGGDTPTELELEAEDLGVVLVEDGELETDSLVREQVQLELPMKALCREGCRGLCPQCGTNLNETSCECTPARDPRWDALAGLETS